MSVVLKWRLAMASDLEIINKIADKIHTSLPERPEVFEEKYRLFNEGCYVLSKADAVVGYGFSHPWLLNDIPALDTFLYELPKAECIFIHDVVVLPIARGHGMAGIYVQMVAKLASQRCISHLALVSVYGTTPVWTRYGFQVKDAPGMSRKLAAYGPSAKYMIRSLVSCRN